MPYNFFGNNIPEWNMYANMIDEIANLYGIPCKYVPREYEKIDSLFGEDGSLSKFNEFFDINLYLEDMTNFAGVGDMFSRFGLQVDDQVSFFVGQQRIFSLLNRYPNSGDLIVFGNNRDDIFEINHVEDKVVLYPFGKNYCFKLYCKKWRYSHEITNTGIPEIDALNELKSTDEISDNDATITSPNNVIINFDEDNPYNDI